MSNHNRKKLFVDAKVQGALVRRVLLYWVCCLMFVTVPLLIGKTFSDPTRFFFEQFGSLWSNYWPLFCTGMSLLPFVLYDVVKFSNRFAGPLMRFRRELRRLADGEEVEPLQFRDGDFWQDLAVRFNQVAARVKAAERGEECDVNGHEEPQFSAEAEAASA